MVKVAWEYCQDWDPKTNVKWDLLIIVALATAMRRGEFLNCTWDDIDFEKQTIEVSPKSNTDETWEWQIKDHERRMLPLTTKIVHLLANHQSEHPEGYPYVFVPTERCKFIQEKLRPSRKWTLSDPRLKVVNNFTPKFKRILQRAHVKEGDFHDLRKTALSNWLANGMSEYDVMTLAGHASFSTTHRFYLAMADDLVDRARRSAAQSLSRKLLEVRCK
jgi:integrase